MRFGPCDGVSTVGGGVRKPGFKVSGGVELSFSGFCKIAACVNLGVTLKGLMGVENAAVAVEESCVLDVKSGTVLIISSGRVLLLNCSLSDYYRTVFSFLSRGDEKLLKSCHFHALLIS